MKSVASTCLAILLATPIACSAWTPVPLPNPSFETWSGDTPEGWTRFDSIAPEGCATPNTIGPADDALAGTRSLECRGDASTCSWQAVLAPTFAVRPGQVYRLEGSMRTVAVDTIPRRYNNSQILLVALDAAGKRVAFARSPVMTGTHDWTRVQAQLAVPQGAATIQAGAFLSIPGTARFDDFALSVLEAPTIDPQATRNDRWHADLAYLGELVESIHPRPFAALSRDTFRARLAALDGAVETLDDEALYWQTRALTIALGDPHTALGRASGLGPQLPVSLRFFGDELRVVATLERDKALLGARITAIDGRPLEEVLDALRSQIAYTHENWFREQAPGWCKLPAALRAVGVAVAAGDSAVTYAGVTDDGRSVEATVVPAREGDTASVVYAGPAGDAKPLCYRDDRYYSFRYLPDRRTLYFKDDAAVDDPQRPLRTFAQALIDTLDARPIDRFIVDLRFNSGGSNLLVGLWRELGARVADGRIGRLFVITGRRTFSAAVYDADFLRQHAGAIVVGEATGMAPVHPGEVQTFQLPGNGLTFSCSTTIIQTSNDPAPALMPDVDVETSWSDFLAGRDAAMEAVWAYAAGGK